MDTAALISVNDFCVHYQVSYSFVESLQQADLVQITTIEKQAFFEIEQLNKIEKLVRMHTELDINAEGIETIVHLLDKISHLQQQLKDLQQKLRLYDENRP